jgi:hypothetical protein
VAHERPQRTVALLGVVFPHDLVVDRIDLHDA